MGHLVEHIFGNFLEKTKKLNTCVGLERLPSKVIFF